MGSRNHLHEQCSPACDEVCGLKVGVCLALFSGERHRKIAQTLGDADSRQYLRNAGVIRGLRTTTLEPQKCHPFRSRPAFGHKSRIIQEFVDKEHC